MKLIFIFLLYSLSAVSQRLPLYCAYNSLEVYDVSKRGFVPDSAYKSLLSAYFDKDAGSVVLVDSISGKGKEYKFAHQEVKDGRYTYQTADEWILIFYYKDNYSILELISPHSAVRYKRKKLGT